MTTLIEKQNSIIDDFELFDDWMQKYEYLIELGKDLPIINPEDKKDSQLIEGCQSRVWLDALNIDGKMKFKADSDAIITKGIISLLIDVLDNQSPVDIVKSDLFFINKIGLQDHLSPTRANGLLSMVKRMKQESLKCINQ
tara:strand:- start:534 stop:953 length:420 start_codon:yes stop_codon:yes gene_type:complete